MNKTVTSLLAMSGLLLQAPASAASKEELEKEISGKRVCTVEVKPDDETQHSEDAWSQRTRYTGCREHYTCFQVQMPESTKRFLQMHSAEFRRSPRSLLELFHGTRLIWKEDGSCMRIENYYAGTKHGIQSEFRAGKPVSQAEYRFGVRHGISREFYNDGKLQTEDEWYDGKRLTRRIYRRNGSVDRYVVGNVIWDQRDERNNPIKKEKSTQQTDPGDKQ